jgi:hypothetical protein
MIMIPWKSVLKYLNCLKFTKDGNKLNFDDFVEKNTGIQTYIYKIRKTTNLNLEKLCKLQKRAARIILNAKYYLKILFKKLGWLSIQNRLEYHKSVLMYKCINNCEQFVS